MLIAPYLRKSGAFGVADFLAFRFASRGVRLTAAHRRRGHPGAGAGRGGGNRQRWSRRGCSRCRRTPPAVLVVLLVLSGTVLGGMRSVTLTALAQYIVLAIAFVVPAAIVSTIAYSLPVPQIAAGLAYQRCRGPRRVGGDLAPPLASRFLPLVPAGGFQLIAVTVALAAGVAALPHLLMRSATVDDAPATRRSIGWALVFVLVVALTVPAYATFARLALLRDMVGSAIARPARLAVRARPARAW